jgi:hypothetical protein
LKKTMSHLESRIEDIFKKSDTTNTWIWVETRSW